jgi:hypothetical protein
MQQLTIPQMLSAVFGDDFPEGVSYCWFTRDERVISFYVGKTGDVVHVNMTDDQFKAVVETLRIDEDLGISFPAGQTTPEAQHFH